jgi:membrane-associated phospholipid phosphatase
MIPLTYSRIALLASGRNMRRVDLAATETNHGRRLRISVEAMFMACLMFGPAWAGQDREQGPQAAASAAQQVDKQRTEKRQPDVNSCSRRVAETAFLKNLWCDQKTIWSTPLSARQHLGFILPFAGATAALIATDQSAGREFSERPPGSVLDASTDISHLGSAEGVIGFAGAFYGVARLTRNERMRETALLSFEALADSGIVQGLLKVTTQRERPTQNNGQLRIDDARGKFWSSGSSFPSGHAMSVWALASVFASRYPDKPAVKYGACGLAALISASRLTARRHFPSDVLVGGVFGYLIGRYVVRAHTH